MFSNFQLQTSSFKLSIVSFKNLVPKTLIQRIYQGVEIRNKMLQKFKKAPYVRIARKCREVVTILSTI